jgi:hypothetical protein
MLLASTRGRTTVGTKIQIVREALLNAASGLEKYAKPDLDQLTDQFASSYHVDPPGWGVLLSAAEAFYNMVGDYEMKNLRAASEAFTAVAAGLRKTVDNYDLSEKANVDMFLGSPSQDAENWGQGWLDTGLVRTFHTLPDGLGSGAFETITVGTQLAFIAIGVATASMAPTYLPAPIAAALLVANGFSMIGCARELAEIAGTLDSDVKAKFDSYSNSATAGWLDDSVVEYKNVVGEISAELLQAQKAISAMSSVLIAVVTLLTTFWVAFLAFTGPFFITVLELTLGSIGPWAVVVEPILQALGALASASWLTAVGTVVGLIGAGVAVLIGVIKEFTGMQTFDKQGDATPDIRQIKIAWHSS